MLKRDWYLQLTPRCAGGALQRKGWRDTVLACFAIAFYVDNKYYINMILELLPLHTTWLYFHPILIFIRVNPTARIMEEERARKELQKYEGEFGDEHRYTLRVKSTLAYVLFQNGKVAEAEALERNVLLVQTRVLGAEHSDTLTTQENLACSLSREQQNVEATEMLREVFQVKQRVLGAGNLETQKTQRNLAVSLSREQKYAQAEKMLLELFEAQEKELGAEHSETQKTANELQVCQFCKQESEESSGRVHRSGKLYRNSEQPRPM